MNIILSKYERLRIARKAAATRTTGLEQSSVLVVCVVLLPAALPVWDELRTSDWGDDALSKPILQLSLLWKWS